MRDLNTKYLCISKVLGRCVCKNKKTGVTPA